MVLLGDDFLPERVAQGVRAFAVAGHFLIEPSVAVVEFGLQADQALVERFLAVQEFLQFDAALSLLPVLPPDEAVLLLRERATRLTEGIAQLRALVADLSNRTLAEMAEPNQELPAPLLGQKLPALFI